MSTTPLPQDEAFISLHELLQALCHDSVYGDDMNEVANTLIRKRFGELRPPVAWVRRKPSGELVIAPDEPSKIDHLLCRVADFGENGLIKPDMTGIDQSYERLGFLFHEIDAFMQQAGVQIDCPAPSPPPAAAQVPTGPDLDPTDLPEELDAANMAFRAVLKGYGNSADTFRNRLIEYLNSHFRALGSSAIERIATVANPDKARGRPAKFKE